MTVEWLNYDRTRAIVTVGWFRKRQATVYRDGPFWYFEKKSALGMTVQFEHSRVLDSLRDEFDPWTPVGQLPQARVVED